MEDGDKFSTNKALLSFSCMAKLALYDYLPYLVAMVAGVGVVFVGRLWYRKKAAMAHEVQTLASMVFMELQAKKGLHHHPDNRGGEGEVEGGSGSINAGIVVDHLRDKLLQGYKEKSKSAMWRRVQALVQADSRVSEYASWKNGAQVNCWEWLS
jgi:hypothetical protein